MSTLNELIEDIMKAKGFKYRSELRQYLEHKYHVDLRKLSLDELVEIILKEWLSIEE